MIYCYVLLDFVVYLSIYVNSMLNIASNDSLVDQLTLICDLTDWLVLNDKVFESSTGSSRINLLNCLNNNVSVVFLWYGELIAIKIKLFFCLWIKKYCIYHLFKRWDEILGKYLSSGYFPFFEQKEIYLSIYLCMYISVYLYTYLYI